MRSCLHRVQSEYLEMPGLSLTLDQACRLWGLDDQTCSRVLKELVVRGFLALSERGTYARRTSP